MKILKNKYGELRSGFSILACFAVVFLAQVIVNFLINFGFVFFLRAGVLDNESILSVMGSNLLMLPGNLLYIVAILLLFKIIYKRPFGQIGLPKKGALLPFVTGGLFGIVSIVLVWGVLILTGQAWVQQVDVSQILGAEFWLYLLLFISVGFNEEIMCRGYMMTALKTTRNRVIIFVLPAALFALLHAANPNVSVIGLVNIFLIALLFAYMFIVTGSLWMPIGYHITWNFVQGNVLGLNVSGLTTNSVVTTRVSGNALWTGGAFGAEGGLVTTLIIALGFLYVHFIVKRPDTPAWTISNGLPFAKEGAQHEEKTTGEVSVNIDEN